MSADKFELIYLDSPSRSKIPLQTGVDLILGRGQIADTHIDDRRISRNHCEVTSIAGQLYVKSISKNPCFISQLQNSSNSHHLLNDGESLRLEPGDVLSLLPDSCHFEVAKISHEQSSGVTANGDCSSANSCNNTEKTQLIRETCCCSTVKEEAVEASDDTKMLSTFVKPEIQEQSDESPSSSIKARLSCMYGRSCYRKNPVHFSQFCHPGDSDYLESSTSQQPSGMPESVDNTSCPPCQYGAACYRKNPQHRLEYWHPTPKKVATAGKAASSNVTNFVAGDDEEIEFDDECEDESEYENSFGEESELEITASTDVIEEDGDGDY